MTTSAADEDFRTRMQQLEGLLQQVEEFTDPAARARTSQILQAVLEFHGAGLSAILDRLRRAGDAGRQILDALTGDELIASLLLLHGLHPVDLETRLRRALESVRPYLDSHGGRVLLLGVTPQRAVRLRLEGSCHGCPSSQATVRQKIEEAIYAAAPDVSAVDFKGPSGEDEQWPAPAAFVPLSQLTVRRRPVPAAAGFANGEGAAP